MFPTTSCYHFLITIRGRSSVVECRTLHLYGIAFLELWVQTPKFCIYQVSIYYSNHNLDSSHSVHSRAIIFIMYIVALNRKIYIIGAIISYSRLLEKVQWVYEKDTAVMFMIPWRTLKDLHNDMQKVMIMVTV